MRWREYLERNVLINGATFGSPFCLSLHMVKLKKGVISVTRFRTRIVATGADLQTWLTRNPGYKVWLEEEDKFNSFIHIDEKKLKLNGLYLVEELPHGKHLHLTQVEWIQFAALSGEPLKEEHKRLTELENWMNFEDTE